MSQVSTMVLLGEVGMLDLIKLMGEGLISKFLSEKSKGLHPILRKAATGGACQRARSQRRELRGL